jgi:PilZ domain-containing protein
MVSPVALTVHFVRFLGDDMGERRKARRYDVALPLQVCTSRHRPAEFHTAQLRDISRTGLFFHSNLAMEPGSTMELTFALPGERDRGTSVLVRASAKVLRVTTVDTEAAPIYGVAATIDRLDFVRPMVTNAA